MPSLDDLGDALPKILKVVGSVVAPTTLLTALLLYFGRLHVSKFFRYFGINFTALELTPQDYLIRSADGLFVPLAVAASVVLVALWLRRLIVVRLPPSQVETLVRVLTPVGGVSGLVLVGVAVAAIVDPVAFGAVPELPGLALAVGVLLLAYVSRLLRQRVVASSRWARRGASPGGVAVTEWAAVFVLVSVGLFWAVGNYAAGVGVGRGQEQEAALGAWPDTVLYSERNLSMNAPGVRAVACRDPEAAYRYRYDGFKLVLQSGEQYVLLPSGWSQADGAAILLPRSDTLRLEFMAPGASLGLPPAC